MAVFPDIFPYNYLEDLGMPIPESGILKSNPSCEYCNARNERNQNFSVKYAYLSEEVENQIIKELLARKSFSELRRLISVLNLLCLRKIYDGFDVRWYLPEGNTKFENIFSKRAVDLLEEFHLSDLEDWPILLLSIQEIPRIIFDRDRCHESYEPCSEKTNCYRPLGINF